MARRKRRDRRAAQSAGVIFLAGAIVTGECAGHGKKYDVEPREYAETSGLVGNSSNVANASTATVTPVSSSLFTEQITPNEHDHSETDTDSVASTTAALAASGQFAFEDDGFFPSLPWVDNSHMAAVQAMMKIQWSQEDFAPFQNTESESVAAPKIV